MLKYFTLLIFSLLGWKVKGFFPPHIKKGILIAAPHTSNWDFIFALAYFYKLKIPFRYTIKQEWLERFFIGGIMKKSGAIGIDREQRKNMVDALSDIFNNEDNIVLIIQPEGTRKNTKYWKTGFYRAAQKAEVPLVLGYLDYKKKTAGIGPSFIPTGDYKKDMDVLKDFYKDINPKHPERFSLDIYKPTEQH